MVPFDIDTIDTQGELINNLLNYLKQELIQSSNLRDITSYAISKFLIRPDLIKKNYLDEYINFCVEKLTDLNSNNNIFVVLGILLSLFDIFKNGQQNELTKYLDIMINKILPFEFPAVIKSSGMYIKTLTKLIQRVGIVLLKPRPQTWRYHLMDGCVAWISSIHPESICCRIFNAGKFVRKSSAHSMSCRLKWQKRTVKTIEVTHGVEKVHPLT